MRSWRARGLLRRWFAAHEREANPAARSFTGRNCSATSVDHAVRSSPSRHVPVGLDSSFELRENQPLRDWGARGEGEGACASGVSDPPRRLGRFTSRAASGVFATAAAIATVVASVVMLGPQERTRDRAETMPAILDEWPPLGDDPAITSATEAGARRARLQRFAFGRATLPVRLPTVEKGFDNPEFSSELLNLKRIDRLTIWLPHGFAALVYHVIPTRANGRLLIYHNGHGQTVTAGKSTIAYFLERGYSLLVFTMPYTAQYWTPKTFRTRTCGNVELRDWRHEMLACTRRPLRYFVEPVAVSINCADADYDVAGMIGLSGGGWTTVVYAALDPRIRRSYSVAGTVRYPSGYVRVTVRPTASATSNSAGPTSTASRTTRSSTCSVPGVAVKSSLPSTTCTTPAASTAATS